MAKVYTGKVMLTVNSVDEYTKMLMDAEEQRQPFRDHLIHLVNLFKKYLEATYAEKTVRKHVMIVGLFID